MKKQVCLFAAAALAVGGMGIAGLDFGSIARAEDNAAGEVRQGVDNTGDAAERAAENTGDAASDAADATGDAARDATDAGDGTMAPHGTAAAPDAEGIRDILASSTEAALTKGGFDDLVERFVDADRNRIGEFAEQEMTDLDGRIEQISKAWQAKYGQEFDINDEELVFNESFRIQQSEIGGDARVAGDVDVKRDATGDADVDANVDNNTGVDAPDSAAADANRNDPGRNIATVTVPASHGMPELTVNMIHEMPDNWRIDIPDTVDGPKLKENLLKHLTMVGDAQATWPADVNEAYRLVSHHVLAAVLDSQAEPAAGGM